jgi:hypothetical protein
MTDSSSIRRTGEPEADPTDTGAQPVVPPAEPVAAGSTGPAATVPDAAETTAAEPTPTTAYVRDPEPTPTTVYAPAETEAAPVATPPAESAPVEAPAASAAHAGPTEATTTAPATAAAPAAQDWSSTPATPAAAPAPAAPVYVQAPVAPDYKNNRGFGIAVQLLGTLIFAAAYLAIMIGVIALYSQDGTFERTVVSAVQQPTFWLPVAAFLVFSIILAILVNRASWWAHILLGLVLAILVAVVSLYALLAVGLDSSSFSLRQASSYLNRNAMQLIPFVVVPAVLAREIPIWTGAWIGSRGRKVRAKNVVLRDEYERSLASSPRGR